MLRLRDDQWERIREHFPEEHVPEGRPGRKPGPARAVLEAVLWILNTGAQWHMLPQCYPTTKRCIADSSSGANAQSCGRF
jgi:transposase